ncbi:MAG TPA: bifunctional DNA-formamidopyrimidine glycosylase/DNA-(apurinic or apyrimidinic site) lyase [Aliidongia sp.]|nr:bifunctional DNA-formamidopyrimidine glycosylase/DNA-(apurinic or apyrimidinic site) lyase [Aliidongia sp.]
MPELPEVETVCRGLAAVLDGRVIAELELRRPDLRFPLPLGLKQLVEGRRVSAVKRRAKYILIHLDDGGVLIAHLGMSGRMTIGPAEGLVPILHDHVIFRTDAGMAVRFNDARRFGFLDYATAPALGAHKLLRDLGPEPLGNEFNGPMLAASLAGKLAPVKAALLDQKIVAGLGNIYVSESLFQAGLSPRRLAGTVTGGEAEQLAHAIKDVLGRAIAAGGSSLRDYVQTSGELGYFQHQWAVYGKEGEPCPGCNCEEGIQRIVQSNRSTFYCAKRQR